MQPTNPDISQYRYNNNAQRWTDTRNGRFVSEQSVISEMRRHQNATFSALDGLTRELYAGRINLAQWELAVASQLKDAHLAQAIFAVGGRANMGNAEYGRVGGTLRDEYRYLSRFANAIASGQISERQALTRIRQYGKATQQSYWREYRLASKGEIYWNLTPADHCEAHAGAYGCVDLANGSPYTAETLPTVPGAGATTCRGNCTCFLSRG